MVCDLSMQFSLGLTPSVMVPLSYMKVAPPDQVIYRPASTYYVRGDFSRVGDGFASAEWIWDTISIARLSEPLSFLEGRDYNKVYVITDKRDGTYPNPNIAFAMFYAMMWKPVISGEEGVPVAKSPYVIQTVKIRFINLIEVSGYL